MCEFPCFDFTTIHSGKEDLKGLAFHGAFSRNVALESGKDFSSIRHLRRFKKKKNSGWPEFLVTRLKKEY